MLNSNVEITSVKPLPEMRTLSRRVRALRRTKNMTRSNLALASGLSTATIRRVEEAGVTGYNPKLDTLGYIAFGLRTPLVDVIATPKKIEVATATI